MWKDEVLAWVWTDSIYIALYDIWKFLLSCPLPRLARQAGFAVVSILTPGTTRIPAKKCTTNMDCEWSYSKFREIRFSCLVLVGSKEKLWVLFGISCIFLFRCGIRHCFTYKSDLFASLTDYPFVGPPGC